MLSTNTFHLGLGTLGKVSPGVSSNWSDRVEGPVSGGGDGWARATRALAAATASKLLVPLGGVFSRQPAGGAAALGALVLATGHRGVVVRGAGLVSPVSPGIPSFSEGYSGSEGE